MRKGKGEEYVFSESCHFADAVQGMSQMFLL